MIIVYDSLNLHASHGTKMQSANLMKTSKKSLNTKIASVFAATYCTALVNGQDPLTLVYNQGSMRKQLEPCLSRRKMEPFSSIRP